MTTTWLPADLSSICPEQQAPLTQCSPAGFMFLSLVVRLFGGVTYSINYPPPNPYSSPFQHTHSDITDYNAGFPSLPQYNPYPPENYEHNIYDPYERNPFTDLGNFVYQTPRNPVPSYSDPSLNDFGSNFKEYEPVLNYNFFEKFLDLNIDESKVRTVSTGKNKKEKKLTSKRNKRQAKEYDFIIVGAGSAGCVLANRLSEVKKWRNPYANPLQHTYPAANNLTVKIVSTETYNKDNNGTSTKSGKQEYDFIIVGAGSAGCVLANRLSEEKQWKVLLLEAGPEEPDVTMVPSLAPTLGGSNIDWRYRTQPEPLTCRSIRGQTCAWPRGKTMGGSSAINYMVYMRGNRLDYDFWADLGNQGWSYSELLPYFKKSENNRAVESYDTHYHGIGGPITVERFPYLDSTTVMLFEAFKESGLPVVDLTGENNIGTNIGLSTSRDGRRMSTNVAYIKPIRNVRSNIDIVVNAFATKLIIDPKTKTALGVTYIKNGISYNVFAKKEVIVSSGSLNSPKILMLSGIGPKAHLESLNIPVIANLAVGRNLQDHVTTEGLVIALSNKTSTLKNSQDILQKLQEYHQQGPIKNGPLSTIGPSNSISFIKTKYASANAPDVQILFDGKNVEEFYSDPQTYLETNINPLAFYNGITTKSILLTPKSRGVILLNNSDPVNAPPLIYPGFFTKKEDMDVMVEGLRFAVSLEETKAFKQNGAHFVRVPMKNCENYIWGSYDYFACILIQYTSTLFHPVGTCKMGPAWDKEAVVDSRLRVYGVNRLRVIDASIMPLIVRGNTNIPTVTIAERASDMIKEDYLEKATFENVFCNLNNYFKSFEHKR